MTEAEWLVVPKPKLLVTWVLPFATERKLRLFAVACCRRIEYLIDQANPLDREGLRELVRLAEECADGRATLAQVRDVWQPVQHEIWGEAYPTPFGRLTDDHGERLAGVWEEVIESLYQAEEVRRYRSDRENPDVLEPGEAEEYHAIGPREERAQSDLLRDIFGNPFRPAFFSPSWRTDTAVSLARQMYESRDFSAMPILADALQDAGCDNTDILAHCRDAGATHVRGCWVVDFVLGQGVSRDRSRVAGGR